MRIKKLVSTTSIRTTFYSVNLQDAIDAMTKTHENVWLIESLKMLGWDAINFKVALFGSDVIEDVLYICETDGADIIINNKPTDPELALTNYSIEDLQEYIQPATDDIILRYITTYEIKLPDFDKWAPEMLTSTTGKRYTFTELVEGAAVFERS